MGAGNNSGLLQYRPTNKTSTINRYFAIEHRLAEGTRKCLYGQQADKRYKQYFMKQFYTVLFTLLAIKSFGQVQKGKYLTSGTFNLKNRYEGDNPYKRLQIGVTNKTGYFLSNSVVIGIKTNYTWTHEKTIRFATLQQGGSQWYESGLYNRHEYAFGLFGDKYFKLGKKLYITVGLYGQYSSFSDIEKGDFFDQNGNKLGIGYEKITNPSQVARIGLTNSLVYFLNQRWGINCLVSSFDVTIHKKRPDEFEFNTPLMNFGIEYHFPN
jgi:hypothetical protein